VLPATIPDLFEDDQLVVLGRYIGEQPLAFTLDGNYLGRTRTFRFAFSLDTATTKNAFVPRLWASRRIGVLVDAIRQAGANGGLATVGQKAAADPKLKELVDEIVRLSTEFGILTEYTAFLAREGTDLTRRDLVLLEAGRNFRSRASRTRSGIGAVNQSLNIDFNRNQLFLNTTNGYFDENMNYVSVSGVQQVNDRAFYRRSGRWVDSRLVVKEDQVEPRRIIAFGSEEFRELARRLADQSRSGTIALDGDILMLVDGEPILVKGP
jgi:Ca-activated chloride channel family protein